MRRRSVFMIAGISGPEFGPILHCFDPKTVIDEAVWEKPHQYAKGIEYVFVNGELVLEKGRHTNARPGKILYGSGKTKE